MRHTFCQVVHYNELTRCEKLTRCDELVTIPYDIMLLIGRHCYGSDGVLLTVLTLAILVVAFGRL